MSEIEVIFGDFNRTYFRSVAVGIADLPHTSPIANADSDRNKCHENRLITDKIRIKILQLLATTSKKSNILEKIDDFYQLLRVIIDTGD